MEHPDKLPGWRWYWLFWLAYLRLSPYAVCVMSRTKGAADFHDYPDSVEGYPDHFISLTCKRCGKKFMM